MQTSLVIPTILDSEEFQPLYASAQASGADVMARLDQPFILEAGASALIPTGIRVEIPAGYEIQVRPRSGLALKHGITVLNTPGTIDADYRGEIGVILINHSKKDFTITPGLRIAQLVVTASLQAEFKPVDVLSSTQRGEGGFGHTGLSR